MSEWAQEKIDAHRRRLRELRLTAGREWSMLDEIERLRVRVAVLEGAGAVMEEATGTLLAELCNERNEARRWAEEMRKQAARHSGLNPWELPWEEE